jgi:hypothetical protein
MKQYYKIILTTKQTNIANSKTNKDYKQQQKIMKQYYKIILPTTAKQTK